MESRSQAPKLALKKETITKLSDDQMKKVIGGVENPSSSKQSCNRQSCNSAGSGSCGDNSCNCATPVDPGTGTSL